MFTYLTSTFIIALTLSDSALGDPQPNKDIAVAMEEMQRANYFTFVMLLNMVRDKIPPNATFLLPTDRVLSKTLIPDNHVLEFLLRHSIPSPMLFDDMRHFPTETMIPTYEPDYMLRIVNGGRKRFYLNNAQITGINICTAGSSFRCHGINDVLNPPTAENRTTATCPNANPPTAAVEPSPVPSKLAPQVAGPPSSAGPTSPSPTESNDGFGRPNSPGLLFGVLFTTIFSCTILSMKFSI